MPIFLLTRCLPSLSAAAASIQDKQSIPSDTLVVKNLPFSMRREELEEHLASIEGVPLQIKLREKSGTFSGMVFLQYQLVEEAVKTCARLNGKEVFGRKVQVEFKRTEKKAERSDSISSDLLSRSCSLSHSSSLSRSWSPDPVFDASVSRQLKEFLNGDSTVLTFPANLASSARRLIHAKADALGLSHSTHGPPGQRTVRLEKARVTASSVPSTLLRRPTASPDGHAHARAKTVKPIGFRPRSGITTPPQFFNCRQQPHPSQHAIKHSQKPVCRPLFPAPVVSGSFPGTHRAHFRAQPPTCAPYRQPKGPASAGRGFDQRAKDTSKC